MKNKTLKFFGFLFALFFVCMGNVKAASANISVTSSASKVVVGSTVTVTVKISSASPLGSWNFDVANSSNLKLSYSSFGGQYIVDNVTSTSQKLATYTFKFTALSSGTGTVSVRNSLVYGYDESVMTTTNGSTSISILTQAQIQDSYSKNNYLTNLAVDGSTLTPAFNKDTLEYSSDLPPETTSINITATKEDPKSSINGAGQVNVVDGNNRIQINVTAENGNVRTYIINANVKEYDPINVKIGKTTYTVVRKKAQLTAPSNYKETTVNINNTDVPAFKGEITKYTLVGLKDSDGKINLYIYDTAKKTYTLYQELSFNRVLFYPISIDGKDIPKGYKKTTITYNNVKIDAYKMNSDSRYALLYGMNVETGKKNLYMFDSEENTLQQYNKEEVDTLNKTINNYFKYIIIGGSATILFFILSIVFLILFIRRGKAAVKENKPAMDQYLEHEKANELEMLHDKEIKREKRKDR